MVKCNYTDICTYHSNKCALHIIKMSNISTVRLYFQIFFFKSLHKAFLSCILFTRRHYCIPPLISSLLSFKSLFQSSLLSFSSQLSSALKVKCSAFHFSPLSSITIFMPSFPARSTLTFLPVSHANPI